MEKLKEELWKTLQELKEDEFKHFKWFLNHKDILKGFSGIPMARLEKAERQDTVDLMVQKYQGPGALKVTLKVLKNISRNDLVQRLQNSSSGPKDLKNHSVPLKSDFERKKAELGDEIRLMKQERHMKIKEITRSAELSSKSADRHIADSKQAFTVFLESVKGSLANLIKAINETQETTQKQADEFIQELEKEIGELGKLELERLDCTEDNLDILKSSVSRRALPSTKNWREVTISPPSYGRSVRTIVNQLEEKFSTEKEKLINKVKLNRAQEFAKHVTLDPDTANPYLILSDDGKQVYCGEGEVERKLPDNPKRFKTACNVLGKQSFSSGRFYYEVQVEGKTSWDLGVVKESVDRKGSINASPENGYWTICLRSGDKYKAYAAHLSVKYKPKKVGVFVDYEMGSVSFYDVDSADVIHSFTDCSFTEKLYPFFSPSFHHGGNNSKPLIISPVSYLA